FRAHAAISRSVMRSIRCVISSASSSPMWPRSTRSHTMEQSRSRKAFSLSGILATSHPGTTCVARGLGIPPACRGRCRRRKHRLHHPHHIARVHLIQPPHDPSVSRLVDHSGVSHVGGEKQQIHAPPVDASRHRYRLRSYSTIRRPIHSATGTATALPMALYRGESAVFSSINVQSSGKPCKRSHSLGVSRRTAPMSSTLCCIHTSRVVLLLAVSFLAASVGATITPR